MNIYLAKKDGKVIFHTDLAAMEQLDRIKKADKTVTVEEWEAAGSTAYIDSAGKIVLGKTPEETKADENSTRVAEIDIELVKLDMASIRSSRAVARAVAKGVTPDADDLKQIDFYEDQVSALRDERSSLVN